MNRHLVFGVCAFALSGLIPFILPIHITLILLLLLSLTFIASSITAKLKHRFSKVLLCSFLAIVSIVLSLTIHLPSMEKTSMYEGYHESITAEVLTINESRFYTNAVVETRKINNEDVRVKIIVYDFYSRGIKEGDIVDIAGEVSSDFSKDFNFNAQNYNAARKIFLRMQADFVEKCDDEGNSLRRALYDFRNKCFEYIEPLENAPLIRALAIGDKSQLSEETKSIFETLGLSHALAVSGMHLSLIVMSLYIFLHKHSVNKKLLCVVCSACVLFYMALTGFSFSIVRSGIMMIVYFLSLLSRRQNDSITSLFASLLLIIMENPLSIFDVGLQLSFASTLGILTFTSPAVKKLSKLFYSKQPKEKNLKWNVANISKKILLTVITTLLSTVSATLFSLPLLCIYFRSFTVFSIISNITVIFLINYLLIVSIIHIILCFAFSSTFPFILVPTKILCNFLSNAVIKSCNFLSHTLPSPMALTSEASLVIALICAVITLVFLFLAKNFKNFLIYVLLISSFVIFVIFSEKYLFFKDPVVTVSTSKSCNDVIVEDGAYTVLISNDRDKTMSTPLFEMLDFRAVTTIDKAVFFISDEIPHDKIENILSVCHVNEFVFVPAELEAFLLYKEDILKNSKVSFIKDLNFDLSEKSRVELLPDDSYSVCIGDKNEAVITWCLDKHFATVPHTDTAKSIIVFGECDFLPYSESAEFYVYTDEDNFETFDNCTPSGNVQFIHMRVKRAKVSARTYE